MKKIRCHLALMGTASFFAGVRQKRYSVQQEQTWFWKTQRNASKK